MNRVFKLFLPTTSSGTGMGRPTVPRLVQAHDGKPSSSPAVPGTVVLPAGLPGSARMNAPPHVILTAAFRFVGEDKGSVGHKVLSHQVKPVAALLTRRGRELAMRAGV